MKSPNKMSVVPTAARAALIAILYIMGGGGCAGPRQALLEADRANDTKKVRDILKGLLENGEGSVACSDTHLNMQDALDSAKSRALIKEKLRIENDGDPSNDNDPIEITSVVNFQGNSAGTACARANRRGDIDPAIKNRIQFKGDDGKRTVPRPREK